MWAVERNARDLDPNDEMLRRDLAHIQNTVHEERAAQAGGSFKTMLENGEQKFLYRTLLGIGGQFMQQLSGINLCWMKCLFIHYMARRATKYTIENKGNHLIFVQMRRDKVRQGETRDLRCERVLCPTILLPV